MKNWNKICGILTIFFLTAMYTAAQSSKNITYKPPVLPPYSSPNIFLTANNITIHSVTQTYVPTLPVKIISQDYYTKHFGFFCRQELAIEKLTKLPVRFRAGSLQQCNYLEGKK